MPKQGPKQLVEELATMHRENENLIMFKRVEKDVSVYNV